MSISAKVRRIGYAVATATPLLCPEVLRADESGISFWLPGLLGMIHPQPAVKPGASVQALGRQRSVPRASA
jgi:hypothetical protein